MSSLTVARLEVISGELSGEFSLALSTLLQIPRLIFTELDYMWPVCMACWGKKRYDVVLCCVRCGVLWFGSGKGGKREVGWRSVVNYTWTQCNACVEEVSVCQFLLAQRRHVNRETLSVFSW